VVLYIFVRQTLTRLKDFRDIVPSYISCILRF